MDDSATKTIPAVPLPADTTAPVGSTPRGLRLWFGFFLAWMIGLFAIALLMFTRYEAGDSRSLALWLLALAGFYISLCNTLVPLPTTWIILLLASDSVNLFESNPLRIAVVAVLGATTTMIANLNEYHIFDYFLRARLGERIRRTRAYRWAVRGFDASPFQTLTLIAFVPVPVDPVRWLAILRRYSRARFAAAYWLGRMPRYALLAGLSVALRLGVWEIALIQAGIVLIVGARIVRTALRRRERSPAA